MSDTPPAFPRSRPAFALPAGVASRLRDPARPAATPAKVTHSDAVVAPLPDGVVGHVGEAPTRADVRTAERTLQAAAGEEVRGGSMADETLIKASTAAELAGPLALAAMRVLERGIKDPNPHVAFEAARVAATVAPKVVDLTGREATEADPAAKRAALLAALATPAFCALLLEVLRSPSAPARVALEGAGWRAPGAD